MRISDAWGVDGLREELNVCAMRGATKARKPGTSKKSKNKRGLSATRDKVDLVPRAVVWSFPGWSSSLGTKTKTWDQSTQVPSNSPILVSFAH